MFETPNTAPHDFTQAIHRAKEGLSALLDGQEPARSGSTLEAAIAVAGRSQSTSAAAQGREPVNRKERAHYSAAVRPLEEDAIRAWAAHRRVWMDERDVQRRCNADNFLGRGAEQSVYRQADGQTVWKINAGVFHGTWLEYFVRLHFHNALFPVVPYSLLGLTDTDEGLAAVVAQPFVVAGENVRRHKVEADLSEVGFVRRKADDYYSPAHGIVLEDLHDENVLQRANILYFIDPVVYLETLDMKLAEKSLFRAPFSAKVFE